MGLPNSDSLALIGAARAAWAAPIIALQSGGTSEDVVTALDAGADDCIIRPVEQDECRARVRAVLRRHHIVAYTTALATLAACQAIIAEVRKAAQQHQSCQPMITKSSDGW
jgi:two-component system KDP operon response regulator KdpE